MSCNVKPFIYNILRYKVMIINKLTVRYESHVSSFCSFNVHSMLVAVCCDLARMVSVPAVDAYVIRKLIK